MKSAPLYPHYRLLLPTLICSSLLAACGSSETKQVSQENNDTFPEAVVLAPADTSTVSLQARASDSQLSITESNGNLMISVSYSDVVSAPHSQIFLNTDNEASTGFSFYQEAWGTIGADYMIQNQYLYKSLSNNAMWDWQPVAELTNYTNSGSEISIVINKSLLSDPCGTIQAGTMGRNDSWGVEVMYPVATELATMTLASCATDITAPVVTLNGNSEITLTQGDTFTDPGATAIDDIDGDISSSINRTGNVDTSTPGVYSLVYYSEDSSGNIGQSDIRKVTVTELSAPANPPAVDEPWIGLINSMSFNAVHPSGMSGMSAYQDQTTNDIYLDLGKLFIGSFANTQIYLDTDNDPGTGYQAWSSTSTSPETGAEYIIENGVMYRYTGDGIDWSWSDDFTRVPYYLGSECAGGIGCSQRSYSAKMIIPASIVSGGRVGIMAIEASRDWTTQTLFATNGTYTLVE